MNLGYTRVSTKDREPDFGRNLKPLAESRWSFTANRCSASKIKRLIWDAGIMSHKFKPPHVSDKKIQALLDRYDCPVGYHEVRTRFLGSIASPSTSVSPVHVIKGLWDGELPPFDTMDDANELIQGLGMGLWNNMAKHQNALKPFKLTRGVYKPTVRDLERLSGIRIEEIDGFIEGLFNGQEKIDLPEKAHISLGLLSEIYSLIEDAYDLSQRLDVAVEVSELETTLKHFRELTKEIEQLIHIIMQSCKKARAQYLDTYIAEKPTLH